MTCLVAVLRWNCTGLTNCLVAVLGWNCTGLTNCLIAVLGWNCTGLTNCLVAVLGWNYWTDKLSRCRLGVELYWTDKLSRCCLGLDSRIESLVVWSWCHVGDLRRYPGEPCCLLGGVHTWAGDFWCLSGEVGGTGESQYRREGPEEAVKSTKDVTASSCATFFTNAFSSRKEKYSSFWVPPLCFQSPKLCGERVDRDLYKIKFSIFGHWISSFPSGSLNTG